MKRSFLFLAAVAASILSADPASAAGSHHLRWGAMEASEESSSVSVQQELSQQLNAMARASQRSSLYAASEAALAACEKPEDHHLVKTSKLPRVDLCLESGKTGDARRLVFAEDVTQANHIRKFGDGTVPMVKIGKGSYATVYGVPAVDVSVGETAKVVRKVVLDEGGTTSHEFEVEACLQQEIGNKHQAPKIYSYWTCTTLDTSLPVSSSRPGGIAAATASAGVDVGEKHKYGLMVMEKMHTTWEAKWGSTTAATVVGPKSGAVFLRDQQQLVRALEGLIDIGVVHNDNHPGNIGFMPDGSLKLFDFGLSREYDTALPGYQELKPSLLAYSLRLFVHNANMYGAITQTQRCAAIPYIMAVIDQLDRGTYVWGSTIPERHLGLLCPSVSATRSGMLGGQDYKTPYPVLERGVRDRLQRELIDIINVNAFQSKQDVSWNSVDHYALETKPATGEPYAIREVFGGTQQGMFKLLPVLPRGQHYPENLLQYVAGNWLYRLQDKFFWSNEYGCLAEGLGKMNLVCDAGMQIRLDSYNGHLYKP